MPSGVLTVNDVTMDYANLQSPQNGSITVGGNFDVYARGYEPGVTEAGGQAQAFNAGLDTARQMLRHRLTLPVRTGHGFQQLWQSARKQR